MWLPTKWGSMLSMHKSLFLSKDSRSFLWPPAYYSNDSGCKESEKCIWTSRCTQEETSGRRRDKILLLHVSWWRGVEITPEAKMFLIFYLPQYLAFSVHTLCLHSNCSTHFTDSLSEIVTSGSVTSSTQPIIRKDMNLFRYEFWVLHIYRKKIHT
jgi:hypothetical protein